MQIGSNDSNFLSYHVGPPSSLGIGFDNVPKLMVLLENSQRNKSVAAQLGQLCERANRLVETTKVLVKYCFRQVYRSSHVSVIFGSVSRLSQSASSRERITSKSM